MTKYTQKQLREMIRGGIAIDISHGDNNMRAMILKKELYLSQVGYAAGVYGCNGQLYKGHNTGTLYAIAGRTQAIYIFS